MQMNRRRLFIVILAASTLSLAGSARAEALTGVAGTATAKGQIVLSTLLQAPATAAQGKAVQPWRRHSALRRALANLKPASSTEVSARSALIPTASFLALADDGTTVPPDTNGAVGPNHVMTALNSQLSVQDKTGHVLGVMNMSAFFASVNPGPQAFDPRLIFDSLSQRWIFTALANASTPNAGALLAVSQTPDPTGTWYLYFFKADPAGKNWIDFDNVGVNKNWIVLGASRVSTKSFAFISFDYFVFNKADVLNNGAGAMTLISEPYGVSLVERYIAPALTFDTTLDTFYIVEATNAHDSRLRISTVTGAVGAETLTTGTGFAVSSDPYSDHTPSTNLGAQAGASVGIDTNDALTHRCVYRNGSLWCAQSIFLPATNPTRASVQWWQFTPDGSVLQRGVLDDPSGARMYAFPSVAVNANNDLLLGYTRFSTSDYASAACAYRQGGDALNTLQPELVLKSGESTYVVEPDPFDNRWGDFSAACVDPANDLDLWTIQEYAGANKNNEDFWSTWWARISPMANATSGLTITPNPGFSGRPVNFTLGLSPTAIAIWNFGDGATQAGASVAHAYAAPGTYGVTVAVTDVTGNYAAAATLQIFNDANGNGIPDGAELDSDGDGFPDAIEMLAGSNPFNAASTPVDNLPAVTDSLPAFKTKLKIDFKTHTGAIGISGTLPVPAGFVPNGNVVFVEALGIAAQYMLNAKGTALTSSTTFFKLSAPRNGTAKYSASLAVDLTASKLLLANQGLVQNVKLLNPTVTVPVEILFNGKLYLGSQVVPYRPVR